MRKKIVGILVCTLMIASGFASASIIKSETISVDNNSNEFSPYNRGEILLYPPWDSYSDWWNTWSELAGWALANSASNGYSGWAWTSIGVPGIGKARADAHFYHQPTTLDDSFTAPCSGYYDFTFYYSYDGTIDIDVWQLTGWSFLEDNIFIWFVVALWDEDFNWVKTLDTKEIIEEGHWEFIHYKTFDEDIEVSFTSNYIPKGGHVTFEAQACVWEYAAVGGLAWATGEIELNGKLKKIRIEWPNHPPNKPSKPSGPTGGAIRTLYTYTTSATDPDNDKVYYKWDWDAYGSHDYSNWLGPYPSGQQVSAPHSWDEQGTYCIKVKAKDIYNAESGWSDPLSVTMPRNKIATNSLFFSLLEQFPLLMRLLGS